MERHIPAGRSLLRSLFLGCCVTAVILLGSTTAHAADRFWDGGAEPAGLDGIFSNGANWNDIPFLPDLAPGSADVAHFGLSDPSSLFQFVYTVSFTNNPTNQALVVEDDDVTFDLNGHVYTTTFFSNPVKIGTSSSHVGRLTITDGTVAVSSDSVSLWVGFGVNNSGFLTVTTGGLLAGSGMDINVTGVSALTVNSGGDIIADDVTIGGGGRATITGSGSALVATSLQVIGTLDVTAGGAVETTVGSIPFNGGRATVDGPGSRWINSGKLTVGSQGIGSLHITGGGRVSNSAAVIGATSSGFGTVTIAGADSTWAVNGRLGVGGDPASGNIGGTGTLLIQPGGTVNVAQDTLVFSAGVLRLAGGTLSTREISFPTSELSITPGTFDWTSGTLHVGVFRGDLTVPDGGVLAPGNSAGSTFVLGDYNQVASDATLEIEIGGALIGTQFDTVDVSGNAILGGQLQLAMLDGFVPSAGDTFTVLDAVGGIADVFSNVTNGQRLDTGDGLGSFLVHYGPGSAFNQNQIVLSGFLATLPGDADGDGFVGIQDLNIVLGNWNQNVPPGDPLADPSGDGFVGIEDLNVVLGNWNAGTPPGATAVPEPAALTLWSLVGLAMIRRRNRAGEQRSCSVSHTQSHLGAQIMNHLASGLIHGIGLRILIMRKLCACVVVGGALLPAAQVWAAAVIIGIAETSNHRSRSVTRVAIAFLAFCTLVLSGSPTWAVTRTWNTFGSGNFNDPNNWFPAGVPGVNDFVSFQVGSGSPYTVTFPGNPLVIGGGTIANYTTSHLRVRDNGVSFKGSGQPLVSDSTYTVASQTLTEADRGIIIGGSTPGENASLSLIHPVFFPGVLTSLSGAAATIGDSAGATGTLNVNVGTFNITGSDITQTELIVGNNGIGTVNVNSGADVNVLGFNSRTTIGNHPAFNGSVTRSGVTISGVGSTWTSANELFIGGTGDGALRVQNGGAFIHNGSGGTAGSFIGTFSGSDGSATVTGPGSLWNNNTRLSVGNAGDGTLLINNGGLLLTNGAVNNPTTIGAGSGTTGSVNVQGADSKWQTNSTVQVGGLGSGILIISSGGTVISGSATIRAINGGSGQVGLFDPGSSWTVNGGPLTIGLPEPGFTTGPTELIIAISTEVTVAGDINLNDNSTLKLQGGTLVAGAINPGAGSLFEWISGTLSTSIFDGDLTNQAGTLAPGQSIGSTNIFGDYTQFPFGAMELEISNPSFPGSFPERDFVSVDGTANLTGQLRLTLIDGFVPTGQEDPFAILTAGGGLFGVLSNVANNQRLTTTDGQGSFLVNYGTGSPFNPNQIVLSDFIATPLPGDLDGDGFVGITDLNIVLGNWNQTVPPGDPAADPSGDSFVGIEDLNLVLATGTPARRRATRPTSPNRRPSRYCS